MSYSSPGLGQRPTGSPSLPSNIAADVARLKALIRSREQRVKETESLLTNDTNGDQSPAAEVVNGNNTDWSKVLFSAKENIFVVERIDKLISSSSAGYREVDKVFNLKACLDENLLCNRVRSLKSKGNGQYIGHVKLSGGANQISIDGKPWPLSLRNKSELEFIVACSAGNRAKAELCISSLPGFLDNQTSELPSWFTLTEAEPSSWDFAFQ